MRTHVRREREGETETEKRGSEGERERERARERERESTCEKILVRTRFFVFVCSFECIVGSLHTHEYIKTYEMYIHIDTKSPQRALLLEQPPQPLSTMV